ncbi:MAG: twitching motility protein PilT [Lachnospiraceae bacterium]|nr:twitching motility protein PilT [Lachnospiraceae bacterium]
MVQLIVGEKGKGKTKHLLDKVNSEIKSISGNIVYLDRSSKHMYELNNKVRLIDVSEYMIENSNEFLGFILGVLSQDHDLEQMYFDGFLAMSNTSLDEFEAVVAKLDKISEKFNVNFIVSISKNEAELPESVKSKIIISL